MRTFLYPLAFLTVLSAGLLAFGWIVTTGLQPVSPPRTMLLAAPMPGPDLEMFEVTDMDDREDEAGEDFGVC